MRRPILLGMLVVGVAVFGVAAFMTTHSDCSDPRVVAEASVDVGFARDMAVHHQQAVQMASYTDDHAPTVEIRRLAAMITEQQALEIGQMLGWLEAWGLQRASEDPAMSWMDDDHRHHGGHGSDGTMPGMATPGEMDALVNLTGKPLEVRFLQLMVRHHQGGLPMARYAAQHAGNGYVRAIAGSMYIEQAEEINRMRQLLADRDGTPLPEP